MSARSRFSRLIALALATCALTCAFAGSALARPDASNDVTAVPAFRASVGDTNKTPDPVQVDRVLASLDNQTAKPQPTVDNNDNTDTVALILAIAAILTALGAVTLTVTRTHKPVLGA
jgi:hypothetical protein